MEKYKILAVEDDQMLNKIYEINLADESTEVIFALNAKEARAKLAMKPNLIILDIMLPGESGFELLKEIKKNPDTKDVVVLVVSNLSQPADMETAKNLGADEFITKADTPNALLSQKVRDYVKKNQKKI